jgi:transcription initiation factor IIE alpha subunit
MVMELLQHLVDSGLQVVEVVEILLIQAQEELVVLVEVVKDQVLGHLRLLHNLILIILWVR